MRAAVSAGLVDVALRAWRTEQAKAVEALRVAGGSKPPQKLGRPKSSPP